MLVEAPPIDVGQRARRHIMRRVMPYLFILYVINFLDRMNVGAAALHAGDSWGFDR
jgi:ACS family tartrate transporter-like MFS transporter